MAIIALQYTVKTTAPGSNPAPRTEKAEGGQGSLFSVKYLPEEMYRLNYVSFSKVFTYIIINVLYTVKYIIQLELHGMC